MRNNVGLGTWMISGEELSLSLAGGAGLDRGVGNIEVSGILVARGVADWRGRLRIRIACGSGAGVKYELTSGFTGGGEGEGSRERMIGGDVSSCNSFSSSLTSSTPG